MSKDSKVSSYFSSNRSKGGIQKRVVSVPIRGVQKLRMKDDDHMISSPPSDSWAWRKYGQKPIKGSPYPRGYYKCSSSKGCPARKQVERSKVDPHMLLVTYSSDHNHPRPKYSKNNNDHHHHNDAAIIATSVSEEEEEKPEKKEQKPGKLVLEENMLIKSNNNSNVEGPLMVNYASEFGFYSDLEESPSACTAILDRCPILSDRGRISMDDEMAMIFTRIVEEDESLIFSGLGELPECAAVFRRSDATSGG